MEGLDCKEAWETILGSDGIISCLGFGGGFMVHGSVNNHCIVDFKWM